MSRPRYMAACHREGRFWVIDVTGYDRERGEFEVGTTQARVLGREIRFMATNLVEVMCGDRDFELTIWGAHLVPDIYRRRWQYHWPWGVTRPWLPRIGRGSDEWCNPSAYIVTPLGMVVLFCQPGRMRTEADGLCASCVTDDGRDRAEGWNVS